MKKKERERELKKKEKKKYIQWKQGKAKETMKT